MATSFREQLQPRVLFPSLTIGLVFGIRNAVVLLAYALMIFSGELSARLPIGITVLVLGGIIFALVSALGSSLVGIMAGVQDSPAVILGVVIAAMLAGMPQASPETKLYTALATIMLTSAITGLVCLFLGKFKLGNLVSYIPYPVVGGFLAGTGMLLVLGALKVMIGKSVTLFNLGILFQGDLWTRWLGGLCFAVILFILIKKVSHYLVLPGMLIASITIFYLVLGASGVTVPQAASAGWLVNGMPQGGALFSFWNPAGFAQVDWRALFGQSSSLLACVVVSLISLLLNITAMELSTGQEIDLNKELKNTGLANLLAGMFGSSIGYPALGNTTLAYRMGARTRLNGIFVALVMGLSLAFGGQFLGYFPNLVLGGLILFIGIDLLFSWLYLTWFSLSHLDYAIVVFIGILINTLGFLQGVSIGLALAVVLFIVQYSRTRAVRHVLSGFNYQSSIDRTQLSTHLLRKHGDWLYILEMQGYLFFGTVNQVLEEIHAYIDQPAGPRLLRFIILDLRLVSGLDSSAAFSFAKIKRLAQARDIELVLTHTTPLIQKQLKKDLPPEIVHYFPDLDHGIEWCEDRMIAKFEDVGMRIASGSLFQQLARTLPGENQVAVLKQFLKPLQVRAGEKIITQGSRQNGLYMIETGQIVIQTMGADGNPLRLRTLGAGAFFGEMGLYSKEPASADVFAEQPSSLFVLVADDLAELERSYPAIAAALHRFVARYMSERLAKSTATIQAMR